MIVVDSSIIIDGLLEPGGGTLADHWRAIGEERVSAPHLIDMEVLHAIRRRVLFRDMELRVAEAALSTFAALPIQRYPHMKLMPRIWALRENFTAYDAAYVALAEVFDARLMTRDEKLATAARTFTNVQLL